MAQEMLKLAMKKILHNTVKGIGTEGYKAIGRELSMALFDKEYGSTLCSFTQVGKAATEKRIEQTNFAASVVLSFALKMLGDMSSEQIQHVIAS